jgi:hypothetical protein
LIGFSGQSAWAAPAIAATAIPAAIIVLTTFFIIFLLLLPMAVVLADHAGRFSFLHPDFSGAPGNQRTS